MQIDELLEAMQQIVNTKIAYDKEIEAYDGYSWDYYGHHVIKALEDAKTKYAELLAAYIDERIKIALNKAKDK